MGNIFPKYQYINRILTISRRIHMIGKEGKSLECGRLYLKNSLLRLSHCRNWHTKNWSKSSINDMREKMGSTIIDQIFSDKIFPDWDLKFPGKVQRVGFYKTRSYPIEKELRTNELKIWDSQEKRIRLWFECFNFRISSKID